LGQKFKIKPARCFILLLLVLVVRWLLFAMLDVGQPLSSPTSTCAGLWSRATAVLDGRPTSTGYKTYAGYGRDEAEADVTAAPAVKPSPKPSSANGWDEDWEDSKDTGALSKGKPPRASVPKSAAAISSNGDEDDFGEWSSFGTETTSAAKTGGTPVSSKVGSNPGTPSASPCVSTNVSPAPISATKSVSSSSVTASASPGLTRAKSNGSSGGTPTPIVKSDDFFASFGVVGAK
jgi:hypothetical protein